MTLTKFFRDYARQHYDGNSPLKFVDDASKARTLGQWHGKVVRSSEYIQALTVEEMERAAAHLAQFGLTEFRYVAQGSTAICLKSEGLALRIGPAPFRDIPERRELNYVREQHPLVLQASHTLLTQKSRVYFEVTPLVSVMANNEIPQEFKEMTHKLMHETLFEMNVYDRDLAVLPNGTPIYVDPGAVNARHRNDSGVIRPHSVFRRNAQRLGLRSPMSWIDAKGLFAQEKSFPASSVKHDCAMI